jgi:pyruvate dehydrogenase E1 component
MPPVTPHDLDMLEQLEKRALWLSTYMIHYANKVRPNPDAIKVGGHQASTSSVVSLLTALMLRTMEPRDRLALKPHSSPAFHALHVLLGNLPPEKLREFRQFGGIQSYPSKRKDPDEVHFNTGSVGLGPVNAMFGAVVRDYVRQHFPEEQGRAGGPERGRYISLIGDAEMEEGTLYEALVEAQNYHLRDCWWIVDLNRQSLDKLLSLNRVGQLSDIFHSMGWEVIVLKYSRSLLKLFEQPGGKELKEWFDDVSNAEYQTLLRIPPEAYKAQLLEQVGGRSAEARALVERFDGATLRQNIMHLAGHDMQLICEAYDRAAQVQDRPVAILAYTIKGYGLPLAGHKDNHSGLLSGEEIEALRERLGVPKGREFDPLAGLPDPEAARAFLAGRPLVNRPKAAPPPPPRIAVPAQLDLPVKEAVSTQTAFGQALMELSRVKGLAERIVTTAPDVAISTNLGGWINRVGIYQPDGRSDFYEKYHLSSPFRWKETPAGRHLELGIAENNFFSLLGTLGLSYELNGSLLFPVGTVYDVFLNRGLDMLANAVYSQSRFILVGTPSGVTLAPEGGAHQSFLSPLLGVGFPELDWFEPSYAKELEILLCWALDQLQERAAGRPTYFRLSTNPLRQPDLQYGGDLRRQVIAGGYWLRDYRAEPDYAARPRFNLASTGVMTAEALRASDALREEGVYANVITLPAPGRLYRAWSEFQRASLSRNDAAPPYLFELFPPEERHPMVTVLDGHPLALEWIGAALGVKQIALGVTEFGQSGDIASLYRAMHIHADDIVDAVGRLVVDRAAGRRRT